MHLLHITVERRIQTAVFPGVDCCFIIRFGTFVVCLCLLIIHAGNVVFGIQAGYTGIIDLRLTIQCLRALLLDDKITFINGRNQLSFPEKLSLLHIKCMHRSSHPKR